MTVAILQTGLVATGLVVTGLTVTGVAGAIGSGILLTEAGLAKLRYRDLVPGVIANYRVLPDALVAPFAAILPWLELGLGLGLLASAVTGAVSGNAGLLHWIAVPAAALFVVFAIAMAINIRRGRRQIDCGCGRSQLRQPLGWGLVGRNLVLAALVMVHAVVPPAGFVMAEFALALVAGACLFLFTLLFNAITALSASPLASGRR